MNIKNYDHCFYRESDGHYYVKHPNMEWVTYPSHTDGSADLNAMHYLNDLELSEKDYIETLLWLVNKLSNKT